MNMDLSKIKEGLKRLARIPSLVARHFWLSLFIVLVMALAVSAFLFYQYAIFFPEKRIADSQELFQVDRSSYEELINFREQESLKEENFFPDLFRTQENQLTESE